MLSGVHNFPRQQAVIYGRPAAQVVAETAASLDARRLLITTTRSLAGPGGLAEQFARDLGDLCVGVFSQITAHSPRTSVIAGAQEARATGADLLVALGGSSVVDATKVMQLALWEGLCDPRALDDYRIRPGPPKADLDAIAPGIRMIAVPTTLSAAEFTPFAGVTDTERHSKERFTHKDLAPLAVVLDPLMTLATPPELWLSTGLKAVDHAVEQICNLTRAPYGDALALEGLRYLAEGLPQTHREPHDLDARQRCQFGMWLAISGSAAGRGTGASHAIGHTLGGSYGVPHGKTSCVTLPAVLEWNEAAGVEQQRLVSLAMGRADASASKAVGDLVRSLGLPATLADVGIPKTAFQAIAEHTMHDRGILSNPRRIEGPSDIVEILKIAAA